MQTKGRELDHLESIDFPFQIGGVWQFHKLSPLKQGCFQW